MIVSLIEPLSATLNERVTGKSTQRLWSRDQEQDNILDNGIPDGTGIS